MRERRENETRMGDNSRIEVKAIERRAPERKGRGERGSERKKVRKIYLRKRRKERICFHFINIFLSY